MAIPTQAKPTYLDLLHPDGSVNRDAFERVLEGRITRETNLRLCVAAGLRAPTLLPFGEVARWRAACVERFRLGPINPIERNRIEADERTELEGWVHDMQRGAAAQRSAMTGETEFAGFLSDVSSKLADLRSRLDQPATTEIIRRASFAMTPPRAANEGAR